MLPLIQVTGGVADFQVLPRDANDVAAARVSGRCHPEEAMIEARVCDRGAPLGGLDWCPATPVKGGQWQVEISGIPVGGPYDIELRMLDPDGQPAATTAVRGVLVGDIWVLAGQSNMQGVGQTPDPPISLATVNMFTVDDRWALGQDPVHPLLESVDAPLWKQWIQEGQTREELLAVYQVEVRKRGAIGQGPGLPFAFSLYGATGVPVGIIPCALGGSSLEQWNPANRDHEETSLYRMMMRRIAAAGGNVRGIVWYQGESDSMSEAASTYQERFISFVSTVRADLNALNLPFIYVQIGRVIAMDIPRDGWDAIREAQRLAEARLGAATVVPAHDLPLQDLIHLDTAANQRIGRRLALQAARIAHAQPGLQRGPRLCDVSYDAARMVVSLRFSDVNGRLRADGRPIGFTITGDTGAEVDMIRRVDLPADRPDTVELCLWLPTPELPQGLNLWYARGLDPAANINDELDMGMLAFGPVALSPAG